MPDGFFYLKFAIYNYSIILKYCTHTCNRDRTFNRVVTPIGLLPAS